MENPSDQSPPESTAPGEMNLDRLTQAFASMLGHDDLNVAPTGSDVPPPAADAEPTADCEVTPSTIVEAMLFVGRPDNQPLTSEQLAGLMRGVTAGEIDQLIADLNARYTAEGRPYEIIRQGFGYRMTLSSPYAPVRERYYGRMRRVRLSQAAIEVLALVAYNEPLTSDQVARLRGTASGNVLRHLVRRRLLRVEKPQTKPRKTKYFTTQRFLDVFHLRNLGDLPRSEELEPR